MPALLLECFSEEIPSRMQRSAAEQLARAFAAQLEKAVITHGDIKTFVSPRHLAIHIAGLPAVQPDRTEEKKGPKTSAPEAALQGFAQSVGKPLAECETRTIGKDSYYFATTTITGRKTSDALAEIATKILADFTWPKSMRWGAHDAVWVRPMHRITALFDDAVLPVKFHHITASNVTQGHRFLSPDAVIIPHADGYEEVLKKSLVLVDFSERKETIRAQITAVAASNNLTVVEDDDLLNEITGLIEFPTTYIGTFDASFLTLPREVLISEMKHHQRYIALNNAAGELSNHFIVVSNMRHDDGGKVVIEGNARVLRARLSDGAFYYESDQAKKLSDWAKGLKDVVFQAKVGMMNEKVTRIDALALKIAEAVGYSNDKAIITRAAKLCKADLTTGMVGEFPELQGIMGRYYARAQGEHEAVAEAVYEHYKPQGAGDSLPETEVGAIISIADKLDSIISLWAAGEKPTGSKDPLALRRAALGILRILDAKKWALNLADLFPEKHASELTEFFTDRMRQILKDEAIRYDIIEAVLSVPVQRFVPASLFTRVRNFSVWLKTDGGHAALAAIKRCLNLLAAEEKKTKRIFSYDASLLEKLTLPAEKPLVGEVLQLLNDKERGPIIADDLSNELPTYIQEFFNGVLVADPESKSLEARLSLLAGVQKISQTIADFSKLEG